MTGSSKQTQRDTGTQVYNVPGCKQTLTVSDEPAAVPLAPVVHSWLNMSLLPSPNTRKDVATCIEHVLAELAIKEAAISWQLPEVLTKEHKCHVARFVIHWLKSNTLGTYF